MEEEIPKMEEPSFPEENQLIVEEILKKYGLWEIHREGLNRFSKSKNPEERWKIIEGLPSYKTSNLVRRYGEGEIPLESLPFLIERELNVSEEKAKEIAAELEKKLLIFIRPIKAGELPQKIPLEVKPKIPPKKDVYREPIE